MASTPAGRGARRVLVPALGWPPRFEPSQAFPEFADGLVRNREPVAG